MNIEDSKISKSMKECIGVAYISSFDLSADVKIISTRRLLTLLLGAAKINNDKEDIHIIMKCINECEKAQSEYAEDAEANWGRALFKIAKISDMITPMVFNKYGAITQALAFSLQSTPNAPQQENGSK